MGTRISTAYTIVLVITAFLSCRVRAIPENKNYPSSNSLVLHTGNEKYAVIDTNESVLTWKGSNPLGSHKGYVRILKGELMIEKEQLVGGTVEVDMNTIVDDHHRNDNNLIKHLKSEDFFDVQQFPISTIVITKVGSMGGKTMQVTGDLTIKGVTHSINFPATMEIEYDIMRASGEIKIDRTDWGIRYRSGRFYDKLADKTISDSIEFAVNIFARK